MLPDASGKVGYYLPSSIVVAQSEKQCQSFMYLCTMGLLVCTLQFF